jgi:ECF sigma factor
VAVAATLMRQILVDYAGSHGAAKRGNDCKVTLNNDMAAKGEDMDVLAIDAVLNQLAERDPQQGRIVKWRFFAGLTVEEPLPFWKSRPQR